MDVKNHISEDLAIIREALPYQYAKSISKKLGDITPEQVRLVFNNQLKDPQIMLRVLEAAGALHEEQKHLKTVTSQLAETVTSA